MRPPICVAALILALGTCEPVAAETQLEFSLRFSAWKASDVVVIDLQRRVLEVWKGDLRAGTELPIGSWHLMEGADISYDRWGNAADETPKGQPDRVTGRRRVVFLIRDPAKSADDPNAWNAASIGNHANTCAVWVEGKAAFAVQPWERPEPGIVRPHMTETALKTEVVRLAILQQRLRLAATEPDAKRRAVLVVPFIEEENYLARSEALSVLKECGDPAWPVVKPLILDESKLPIHNKLIHLLDKVGRKDAVPLIEAIIRQEMEYWDTLSKEEQQAGSYNPPMHHHYYKLSACLFVLKRTRYRDPEGIVANLYAKWEAHPILRHMGGGGPTSRSPVLEYAAEILQSK